MSKKTGSFQENIRGTFIKYSLVPVAVIVTVALFLFVFSWIMFMAHFNEQENQSIVSEITRTMNICNEMMSDVADSLVDNDFEVKDSEIFAVLYKRTADFGEMGNLIILSLDHKTLFSSKNSVPRFLTGRESYDWGIWHQIYKNKNSVSTILYNKKIDFFFVNIPIIIQIFFRINPSIIITFYYLADYICFKESATHYTILQHLSGWPFAQIRT